MRRTGEFLWQGMHIGTLTKSTVKHKTGRPTTVWFYKPLRGKKGRGSEYAGAVRTDVISELVRELQSNSKRAAKVIAEFGHDAWRGKNLFADSWGAGPFVIAHAGKRYYFEDSDRFGPVPLNAKGNIIDPGYFEEDSPFWKAWEPWKAAGRPHVKGARGRLYCVTKPAKHGRRKTGG